MSDRERIKRDMKGKKGTENEKKWNIKRKKGI